MRLLLLALLITLSSLSLAENIVGFDFGGKFTQRENAVDMSQPDNPESAFRVDNVKLFDYAEVYLNGDKNISGIIFYKTYRAKVSTLTVDAREIHSDFASLLQSLAKRYGEFNTNFAETVLGIGGDLGITYMGKVKESAYNINPNSKAVGGIFINLDCDPFPPLGGAREKDITLRLAYLDHRIAEAYIKSTQEKTDGF